MSKGIAKKRARNETPTTSMRDDGSERPKAAAATAAIASSPQQPSTSLNAIVVVGTYHSVMAGLALRVGGAGGSKFLLKFSVKHHVGCVTQVAVSDRYIASCGTDERLFLFTAKDRGGQVADLGSLAPASEVRTLVWQGNQHLVCGCADGTVGVYRTRDWENVLAVQVHEKSIESLALHPSGALCVTVGLDRHVAMLDMSSGKLITKVKLAPLTVPSSVFFSTDAGASLFVVVCAYELLVFDTRTVTQRGAVRVEKQPRNEIHCACFVNPTTVVFGTEDGSLYVVGGVAGLEADTVVSGPHPRLTFNDVPTSIVEAQAGIKDETKKKHPTRHAARVKTMAFIASGNLLITGDTNGAVIASEVLFEKKRDGAATADETVSLRFVCSANCQGRVTSICTLTR